MEEILKRLGLVPGNLYKFSYEISFFFNGEIVDLPENDIAMFLTANKTEDRIYYKFIYKNMIVYDSIPFKAFEDFTRNAFIKI